MRTFIAWLLPALLIIPSMGSVTELFAADGAICLGDATVGSRLKDPSQFPLDPSRAETCQIAQSMLTEYGKLPKEQWRRDRDLEAQRLESARQDANGRARRCRDSCYETYRTCIRWRWDPRDQTCQQAFNNCMRTCY